MIIDDMPELFMIVDDYYTVLKSYPTITVAYHSWSRMGKRSSGYTWSKYVLSLSSEVNSSWEISFEEVLDFVDEETQVQLLFHLDLFA
jgi:hypothetical protein